MKTLEEAMAYQSHAIDRRDLMRLGDFIPVEQLGGIGLELQEGSEHTPIAFTRENILSQLRDDVAFGFEKALDQRGLSAKCMFHVVMMWNWILEEGLEDWDRENYAMYGLPLFKATALKYGFPDPIPGYNGTENRFADYEGWSSWIHDRNSRRGEDDGSTNQ